MTSDPSGAEIFVNGRSTGFTTPAIVPAPAGTPELQLGLQASGFESFGWAGTVAVPESMQVAVDAALAGGCPLNCPFQLRANRAECVVVGFGDFCSSNFNAVDRNEWPIGSGNEYISNLRVQVAAIVGSDGGGLVGDTLVSLVYQDTWVGRSPVTLSGTNDRAQFRYWADPLSTAGPQPLVGIEVEQEVIAPTSADLQDVLYFRFRLRNVTDDPRHRHWRPEIPEGGFTFEKLYAGMALDADIGSPSDDVGSLLADSVAFIYDLDFQDGALAAGYDTMPPLVGLVLAETPAVARRPFSLWTIDTDWDDPAPAGGGPEPGFGYRVLTAQLNPTDLLEDCTGPGDDIGHCSDEQHDYRLSLTAGPLTLAPGDTATFVMALVYAEPALGQFTSGTPIFPGDPTSSRLALEAVADSLVARARRAVAHWPQVAP